MFLIGTECSSCTVANRKATEGIRETGRKETMLEMNNEHIQKELFCQKENDRRDFLVTEKYVFKQIKTKAEKSGACFQKGTRILYQKYWKMCMFLFKRELGCSTYPVANQEDRNMDRLFAQ